MVLITFDENDIEVKKLIDDYFWYKYYIKSVEDDLFESVNQFKWNRDKQREIIKNALTFMNPIETKRLFDIHKTLFPNKGFGIRINPKTREPYEQFDEVKILYDILEFGIKYWKGLFKELILEHPKITKSKNI
jgi:hypothetical protein